MKNLAHNGIKSIIKPRKKSSHKGDHGHSLLIVGNQGKMGAAVIASRACLRTGTGLLTVSVPKSERLILQIAIPEAMLVMREKHENKVNDFTAIGIGCGIGTDKKSTQILSHLLAECSMPMVLDADALNIIASNKHLIEKILPNTVLTPHPKEFDRLFGVHKNIKERMKTAIVKAKEYKVIIVLKDHETLITHDGDAFLNSTGNAGLAKGGSGDALTGIIIALLSQGYLPFDAAKIGVYLHGLAADLALEKQSTESMLITDVIEYLGQAFKLISGSLDSIKSFD